MAQKHDSRLARTNPGQVSWIRVARPKAAYMKTMVDGSSVAWLKNLGMIEVVDDTPHAVDN